MLRDPGRVPTGFLRSRHGPYVPSRNRNSQLREPAGRYGTAVTVGGMLAEAGTTCPRAPSGCVCAASVLCPALAGSVSRNLLSGTEESRCPRSGRPGTDAVRCRHAARWCITSQACAALLHTNVNLTQLHEHRRQSQNAQIRYSADSTVSQASRPGCGEGNRYATPRNRPGAMPDLVLQAATPAG